MRVWKTCMVWNNNNNYNNDININDCNNNNNNKWMNAVNKSKKRIGLDTTRWARGSTGNCARSLNLTIRTSGIGTNQNRYTKIRYTKSLGLFNTNGYPNLGQRPDLLIVNRKKIEILLNSGFCRPGWPQSKVKTKWKDWLVPLPCCTFAISKRHLDPVVQKENECKNSVKLHTVLLTTHLKIATERKK